MPARKSLSPFKQRIADAVRDNRYLVLTSAPDLGPDGRFVGQARSGIRYFSLHHETRVPMIQRLRAAGEKVEEVAAEEAWAEAQAVEVGEPKPRVRPAWLDEPGHR
jgi:hypothetical protein